ncbi:MAG: T9SS type A sorting domain-containing protein [Bacteroidetes bacterium]|nr:T9SS type A sorting domain-containing protein [Bacteroidota bacterium]
MNPEILDPETIQFYPNPNNGTFTLKFNLKQNGDTQITIKDIQGATVYNEDLKGFEGSYEKVISLGNNAKGNYLINVTQNGFSATKQIVVQYFFTQYIL